MKRKDNDASLSTGNMPETGSTRIGSVWVVTDGKAGDEAQCIGVAEALGAPFSVRRIAPRKPFAWLMPWGPIDPRERPSVRGSPIAPPFPDVAIASGRRSVAYLRHVKKASGGSTFTVFLKDPKVGTSAADLIWVSEHDRLRGESVLVSVTAPHRFSQARIAAAREATPQAIAALAHPRVAVLVGGDSHHHLFRQSDIVEFIRALDELAAGGASLMITASRRTPDNLRKALRDLCRDSRHILWDGRGENPLLVFLANADAIVVTADSTNMIGEAAATGRPVHVFHPSGGHPKFGRFLEQMSAIGVIHPFPGALKTTTYEPINSTAWIAQAICDAFAARRRRDTGG